MRVRVDPPLTLLGRGVEVTTERGITYPGFLREVRLDSLTLSSSLDDIVVTIPLINVTKVEAA